MRGATRTFRDCLNDHFLQRDDFAVTARVLGALFYYSPESHETAPLVQALLTDDWQAQWPLDAERLRLWRLCLSPTAKSRCHRPGSVCLSALTLCRLRRGVPSGWIVRAYYLAILRWRYVSGCAKTGFSLKCNKTSQKIILVAVAAGGLGLPRMIVIMNANNSRHGICFRGRPAFWTYLSIMPGIRLSGVRATGASDSGAMASSTIIPSL